MECYNWQQTNRQDKKQHAPDHSIRGHKKSIYHNHFRFRSKSLLLDAEGKWSLFLQIVNPDQNNDEVFRNVLKTGNIWGEI